MSIYEKYLKEEDNIKWYQDSLEVLSSLRYHLDEILDSPKFVEGNVIHISLNKKKLLAAQEALNKVERFFSKSPGKKYIK